MGIDICTLGTILLDKTLVMSVVGVKVLVKAVKLSPPIHLSEHPAGGVQYVVRAGTSSAPKLSALVVKIVLCDQSLTFPVMVVVPPTIGIIDASGYRGKATRQSGEGNRRRLALYGVYRRACRMAGHGDASRPSSGW